MSEPSSDRITRIRHALDAALDPVELSVEDESHLHRGHAGAREGGGHFRVFIVSAAFESRSRIGRHRMVYDALADEMGGEIHALALTTLTPSEADAAS
jgi:BolA protein